MFLKEILVPKKKRRFVSSRVLGKDGFTLIELLVVIIVLGIIMSIAVGTFQFYTKKAYRITVLHDLKEFEKAEEDYFAGNNRYLGSAGDFIESGNPPNGTLNVPGFTFAPSEGVRIEIISGDGLNPHDPGNPFKVLATHKRLTTTYIFDFSTSQTIEKD